MSEFEHRVRGREIARVSFIDEDEGTIYLELESHRGQFVTLREGDVSDFDVGSVVLLDWDEYEIELAPEELWPEPTWVGVVQLKGTRKTVVKRDGESVTIPTLPDIEYEEGNTVEARDGHGVVEVISDEALRSLSVTVNMNKESDASRFRDQDNTDRDDERATFEDFGGMEEVVERARDLIEVPLKYRKALTEIGARPIKGVLFTGPPGTGKTLLARIIAGEAESAFYPISGPAILTKWFGESEETLRTIFHAAAEEKKGAIIFFDEIDSVASARGSTSHEASRSVVAQLLTLMDGFKQKANVVVIAATNRLDDIDPALRRPGRFDWEIEFLPPPDEQDREKVLRASSRKLRTDDDLSHAFVAQESRFWSAADLAAIWSEAALVAAKDGRERISDEDYLIGFEKVGRQRRRVKRPRRDGGA